jgi:hypothetical protein
MFKFLTPYGRRVLVAVPLSIATAVFFFFAMWVVPELAFFYFMLMLASPAFIYTALTEEV